MGKDGIISCHDRCKTHMQAMVVWQEYMKNKASGTSIADKFDAARSHAADCKESTLVESNTSGSFAWFAANRKLH